MKDLETYVSKGYFFAVIQEKVRSQRQTIGIQTMGANGNPQLRLQLGQCADMIRMAVSYQYVSGLVPFNCFRISGASAGASTDTLSPVRGQVIM